MSERKHGRRYTFKEKREILDYLEKHTYKDTSERFEISETTLSRWRKEIRSGSNLNRTKLNISLPKFWLEYLNEQIEADIWEDYSDAFLTILRDHFKRQTTIRKENSIYLKNVNVIIPKLLEINPNINAMLISRENEVIYKSERWGSSEGIENLIENWKKGAHWHSEKKKYIKSFQFPEKKKNIRSFEFQKETYSVRDISVKHLIAVKRGMRTSYLLGLKRKLVEDDIYIFAITNPLEGGSFLLEMNTLKKAAMGILPMSKEEKKYITSINEEFQNQISNLRPNKEVWFNLRPYNEIAAEWRQNHPDLMKQQKKNLIDMAKQVNSPLDQYERKVIDALEKQIGKKIERITSFFEDVEEPEKVFGLGRDFPVHTNIIIPPIDEDFPAHKFPCHCLALNGKVILLSLFNLGLSEFPSEILSLKNLSYLCLNSSNITEFPKQFSNLKFLETLYLDKNQFSQVPESIIELPKIHFLSMQNNNISQIPVALTQRYMRYIPKFPKYVGGFTYLNFLGNKIKRDSLSKEQQKLVSNMILLV